MAFAQNTVWEVRTTGSDSNGGGFNSSASGTDYSQQTSPQVSYTDLVIGSTTTQLTSAGNPFTSAHVGNIINITGGTGFTTGRYQVSSVSSGVATMDRAVGTASSTGGTGNLGGCLLNPGTALAALNVTGNIIWMKSGTYNTAVSIAPGGNYDFALLGYGTTRGDGGTATLNMTANTTTLLNLNVSGYSAQCKIANINFTTTGTTNTSSYPIYSATNAGLNLTLSYCSFTGFGVGVNVGQASYQGIFRCSFISNGVYGISLSTQGFNGVNACFVEGCYFYGNGAGGGSTSNGQLQISITANYYPGTYLISNCIFANGNNNGVYVLNGTSTLNLNIVRCTIANNTNSGIYLSAIENGDNVQSSYVFANNLIYGNGGWGVYAPAGTKYLATTNLASNAYGSNTSGNYTTAFQAGVGDVTLTASPFVSSSNFALNSTSGGGAACKAAGSPGTFPGSTTVAYPDIGAVQSAASGGGSTPSNYGYVK